MKALSAGAVGLGFASAPAAASSHGGPPDPENWQIRYENDFDSGSLDTSNWSVGWGWGTETTQGSMYTDERAISFGDSTLELSILDDQRSDGRYPVGAIHTKGKLEFGPGTYLEARTRAANLPGVTSNFWSKLSRDPPEWPPEIDIKEVPVRDANDVNRSIHHVHWTTDGQPGGPHSDLNMGSHRGYDHSAEWTVYGLRWLEDSITYYVNGQEHARTDRSDVMRSVNNGAPFYMMLDIMNWPGPEHHPNDFSGYKATHEIDWIRVWEPGSGGGTGGGSSGDGDQSDDDADTPGEGGDGGDDAPEGDGSSDEGTDSPDDETDESNGDGDTPDDGTDQPDEDDSSGEDGGSDQPDDGDTTDDEPDQSDGDGEPDPSEGDDPANEADSPDDGTDQPDEDDATDGDPADNDATGGDDHSDGDPSDDDPSDGTDSDESADDGSDSGSDGSSDDSRPWWRRDDDESHDRRGRGRRGRHRRGGGRRNRDDDEHDRHGRGRDRHSSWAERWSRWLGDDDSDDWRWWLKDRHDGGHRRRRRRRKRRRWWGRLR